MSHLYSWPDFKDYSKSWVKTNEWRYSKDIMPLSKKSQKRSPVVFYSFDWNMCNQLFYSSCLFFSRMQLFNQLFWSTSQWSLGLDFDLKSLTFFNHSSVGEFFLSKLLLWIKLTFSTQICLFLTLTPADSQNHHKSAFSAQKQALK